MNTLKRMRSTGLLLTLLLVAAMAAPATSMAAQPTVNLGTTSTFAVLAGTTITNTGPTTISGDAGGDVGVSPGTAFTGQADVTLSGAVHLNDAVAIKAQTDLVTAYDDAAGRTPVTTIPTELGGTTLKPGVYDSASGTFQITGTLTLDAEGDPDGVFIFKTASTLITASGSNVNLINGARFCRVFWKVGSSATLGTNSRFVGHIFALTSIAAQTGATVQGQLLARNGAVTLDTNTITNGTCEAIPVPATPAIRVTKTAVPKALTSGPAWVTYTYKVTNPGTAALSNVSVTDNKISSVKYVSGDVNEDKLLQHGETWTYTARKYLSGTTENTATAKGSANGKTATAVATLVVARRTVTGGEIPKTATPWYNVLFAGFVLMLIGAAVWRLRETNV